jgi:hypothetical protein
MITSLAFHLFLIYVDSISRVIHVIIISILLLALLSKLGEILIIADILADVDILPLEN